ncbi:MAG TPA: hypothetical protein VGE04_04795 [Chloroflexia bacterium]
MITSIQLEAVSPAANKLFHKYPVAEECGRADRITNRNRPRDLARPRSRVFRASLGPTSQPVTSSCSQATPHYLSIPASPVPFALTTLARPAGHRSGRDLRVRNERGLDYAGTAGRIEGACRNRVDTV